MATIEFVRQWVEATLAAPVNPKDTLQEVARFVSGIIGSKELPAEQLANIQRCYTPIDDVGTLPGPPDAKSVEFLLKEVLRLRSGAPASEPAKPTPQAVAVKDISAPVAPAAIGPAKVVKA